ncbi:hypothetical protein AGMMS49593_03880 [Endomicrobiia bacterium]|nr:hypothetical protein AGMMS49593_03880 [Endomicrobiia bacterium]
MRLSLRTYKQIMQNSLKKGKKNFMTANNKQAISTLFNKNTFNNKKEQERQALHATIWKMANDLRGSVDGWDFKSYVLGFFILPLHIRKPF